MWIGHASTDELAAANRWTVSYFSNVSLNAESVYPMRKIREVATESKLAVDPQTLDLQIFNYIGLENVRSKTGELVDFAPRSPQEVKSRSKTYTENDVLFGRLRPELNKVYLAEEQVSPGVCSNEFIVLRAKPGVVDPRYLRHMLASQFVAGFAAKLRSGASLPRMNASDLLDLAIPIPPMEVQLTLSGTLEMLDRELAALRQKIEWLPGALANGLLAYLNGEEAGLVSVEAEFTESGGARDRRDRLP